MREPEKPLGKTHLGRKLKNKEGFREEVEMGHGAVPGKRITMNKTSRLRF